MCIFNYSHKVDFLPSMLPYQSLLDYRLSLSVYRVDILHVLFMLVVDGFMTEYLKLYIAFMQPTAPPSNPVGSGGGGLGASPFGGMDSGAFPGMFGGLGGLDLGSSNLAQMQRQVSWGQAIPLIKIKK